MDAQSNPSSEDNSIVLSSSDFPRVSLSSDKKENKFYVGEDATITAKLICSLVVRRMVWQRNTDSGSHEIDTRLPKYTETQNENGDHLLIIRNCNESDGGTYILMLAFPTFSFHSNKIDLKVEKGSPEVTLQDVPQVALNTRVHFTARIRGFPKYQSVIWKKDNEEIDINNPKFERNDDSSVLYIKNVKKEDEGIYTIEAINEYGNGQSSQELKVIGDVPDVTFNGIPPAQLNERLEFKATIRGVPKYHKVIWKKDNDDIDITDPKYETSEDTNDDFVVLCIKTVKKEDEGIYTIEVYNEIGKEERSQQLEVIGDVPEVIFNAIPPAQLNERLEFKATIRGVPKFHKVIWKKDNDDIDITDPKYETSEDTNDDSVVLCIKTVEKVDEGIYTIEVYNEIGKEEKSQQLEIAEGSPEVNLQEIQPVAPNTRVDLKATIRGFPRYHIVIWKKDGNNIDTSDPKYESSEDSNKKYAVLCIKNVKKEDEGKYTIEVQNQLGKGQSSQELKIEGDLPNVTLNQIPLANINECLELKAIIHSSPAYRKLIWTKDGEKIDIDEPKYEGSKTNAGYAVLCIKDVEEEDEALYTIEVHNELGMGQSSQKLKIIAEMIFISGPAVVSPSETIFFQAYLSNRNPSNAKWWKIKDQLKTEITFDNRKFYFYQGSNGQHHKIEIHNAEKEDSATYEFTLDCMKSNKLCVQVDGSGKYSNSELGNCLRLFALQRVTATAMRTVFDNLPGTFVEKLKQYSKLISKWKNEEISEPGRQLDSSEDLDISVMYKVIRKAYHQTPKNGWGNRPGEQDIGIADDIERIRYCRNRICHTDASGMETNLFNESVLDLLGAIRRLSNGDRKLLETSCEFFNRAFTKEEEIEMIGKLEDFKQKQEKWNQSLQREECRDKSYEMINFHNVCDSSIIIWDNNSSASQRLLHAGGVCFMNRPLNLGEEVHIRGSPHHLSFENQISIGLTNQDPKTILGTENKKEASKCELKVFNYCTCSERKHTYKKNCSKEFHIYISLCQNATLLMCFNGTKEECHSYTDVSSLRPLWLVIEPDRTETIWISNI